MDALGAVWEALLTGAGLFWRAFWALALGYAVSASIQVFLSRGEAAMYLGEPKPRKVGLAMLLGFASSSCSFAALSATRSIWAKGGHLIAALAFMFASTNLAIEVAALALIFLGWQFALALFVGAPIIVVIMAAIVRLTRPDALSKHALERARDVTQDESEGSDDLPDGWRERFANARAWQRVGRAYKMEWGMVWKELAIGFTIAGAVAALVPASFFKAIFPTGMNVWLLVPLHAFFAPFLAVITVIGSMGNGPLAAILFQNGVVFGGIMAFLYSDFVVPPALKINANYYGWRFALYLGVVFAAAAVVTGVVVHGLYAVAGLLPQSAKDIQELATFSFDYTLFLNVFAAAVSLVLIQLARQAGRTRQHGGHAA
ncbi:MAG: permease [Actinomycetota bacterium]|nr:permease [Actinomycetota bacterium]